VNAKRRETAVEAREKEEKMDAVAVAVGTGQVPLAADGQNDKAPRLVKLDEDRLSRSLVVHPWRG
jgi:hypothetical protein